jgi:hypothetical protein
VLAAKAITGTLSASMSPATNTPNFAVRHNPTFPIAMTAFPPSYVAVRAGLLRVFNRQYTRVFATDKRETGQ